MASQWWLSTVFTLIVFTIINVEGAKIGKSAVAENAEYILGGEKAQTTTNNFDAGNIRSKPLTILECTANMDKK